MCSREAAQTDKMPVTVEDICKQIPGEILNAHIHISLLDEIAMDLASWEELAPFIGLTNTDQNEISQNYPNQYYLQKRQALRKWRDKAGGKATIKTLINIFVRQGKIDLAERIVELWQKKPTCITVLQNYLYKHYIDVPHPSEKQWPSLLRDFDIPPIYVELTLLEVPINEKIKATTANNNAKVLQINDVFKRSSLTKRMVVLVEGVAGSGKTTFSWYACREWAQGNLLKQFHLLIHVQVNNPRFQKVCKLYDLLPDDDTEFCDQIAHTIIDSRGEGVCFLIEGLDEASDGLWELIISNLLPNKDFSRLSFIITSRPSSRLLLELQKILTRRVVLNGFTDKKLNEFLYSVIAQDDERARVNEMLEINHKLKALCTLPINAVIVSYLITYFKEEIPKTQTELFNFLIRHICIRQMQLRQETTRDLVIERLPDDLPNNLQRAFNKLCCVAYTALSKHERYFSVSELDPALRVEINDTLGFLQLRQNNTMFGLEQYYSFSHLSIQQFLAAIQLTRENETQQIASIEQIWKQDPLDDLLPFYAGLTHLKSDKICETLLKVLRTPLDSTAVALTLAQNPIVPNDPRRKAIAAMKCLYECQDNSLMDLPEYQLVCHNNGVKHRISLTNMWLSPLDCLAVAYFMRYKSISLPKGTSLLLDLESCSIGDIGMSILSTELKRDITSITPATITLFLNNNIVNKKALPLLKQLLQGQSNIRRLSILFCFDPKDERIALKYIIEGLSSNSSCYAISIGYTKVSQSHRIHICIYHLILMIKCCIQLRFLNIISFNLRGVMPLLNGALRHAMLMVLQLSNCNVDNEMLVSLGMAISKNPSILYLDIVGNSEITHLGLESFLLSLINRESRLRCIEVDKPLCSKINSAQSSALAQVNKYRNQKDIYEIIVTNTTPSQELELDYDALCYLENLPNCLSRT